MAEVAEDGNGEPGLPGTDFLDVEERRGEAELVAAMDCFGVAGDDRIGPAEHGRVRAVSRTPVSIRPVPARFQAPGERGGRGQPSRSLRFVRGGPRR